MLAICCSLSFAQETDSVAYPSPKSAGFWALTFPGAGQVYNGKVFKAALILSLEALTIWRWVENGNQYNTYKQDDDTNFPLGKHRYLEKRNKYAWWAGFIYLYGFLDAVVDAHLHPFDQVMSEELESTPQEESTNEEGT